VIPFLADFLCPEESVSDLLIRTLITVVKNNVIEFTRNPVQYFHVFHAYALIGAAQVKWVKMY
jgi:hypothetical protein